MNPAHFVLDERLAAESQPLCRFELSDVRLMNDANYPWLILVPRIAGVRELIDLDAGQRRRLGDETDRAARLLRDAFRPRKLNVAALGNVVWIRWNDFNPSGSDDGLAIDEVRLEPVFADPPPGAIARLGFAARAESLPLVPGDVVGIDMTLTVEAASPEALRASPTTKNG